MTEKKLLVLDMDETLLHSTSDEIEDPDLLLKQYCPLSKSYYLVYVKLRPFLSVFLRFISQYYEIAIFTAGAKEVGRSDEYAEPLIEIFDTERLISQKFYRENCTACRTCMLKDLRITHRDLKDVILIDVPQAHQDNSHSMKLQPQNGLLIKSFFSDSRDKELMRLAPFLVFLSDLDDVRVVKDWYRQFNYLPELAYTDRAGKPRKLRRPELIRFVADSLNLEYQAQVDSAVSKSSGQRKGQAAAEREYKEAIE